MHKLLLIMAAILISGCVSATVDEPSVCDTQALTQLPSAPVTATVPGTVPVSFSQNLDLSGTLSKINKVADSVSINVTQMLLANSSGNMSWLQHVDVNITAQGMQSAVLVQYDLQPGDQNSTSLSLPVKLDNNTLYSYLSQGPVTLTFTLSGSAPTQVPNLSGTMCLSASASVSKSL